MKKRLRAVNSNVLVEPLKDIAKDVFIESDSRKDIQFGKVESVEEGSKLRVGEIVCYNPRSLTNVVVDGKLKGALREHDVRFILENVPQKEV